MAEELTQWIKTGYGRLKPGIGIPDWFMPQQTLDSITDELGHDGLIQMTAPLELAGDVETFLAQAPDPQAVSDEAWADAIRNWPLLSQVKPLVQSFYEASDIIQAEFQRGRLGVEPSLVVRGLAVFFMAPFLPQGEWLLPKLSVILGAGTGAPAASLIDCYAETVIWGDQDILDEVDRCIMEEAPRLERWSTVVMGTMMGFPFTPRLIAVTPPLSGGIADALIAMMKEGQDGNPGRDHPESQCN